MGANQPLGTHFDKTAYLSSQIVRFGQQQLKIPEVCQHFPFSRDRAQQFLNGSKLTRDL